MAGYIIVDVRITDRDRYAEYVKQVMPTLQKYGGRFIVRGGTTTRLEGTWDPGRIVVLEFDSVERAREWWASEEYRDPKALRQSCSVTQMIAVEGV